MDSRVSIPCMGEEFYLRCLIQVTDIKDSLLEACILKRLITRILISAFSSQYFAFGISQATGGAKLGEYGWGVLILLQ